MKPTLLLTAWFFPIRAIPWENAIKMVYEGTVDVVAEYDEEVSSPSTTWKLPAVIRLKKKTPHEKRSVKYSDNNVKIRDRFTCQYCGDKFERSELTMDHVVPRSKGGPRSFENIVAACKPCNGKKANLSCDESGMFPKNRPATPEKLPVDMVSVKTGRYPEEWTPYLEAFGLV